VARGKQRKREPSDPDDAPKPEPIFRPHSVQGRCAYCMCGEGRIELPGPTKEDREKMRGGSRVYYKLWCPGCVKQLTIEDPWLPRDSGRT